MEDIECQVQPLDLSSAASRLRKHTSEALSGDEEAFSSPSPSPSASTPPSEGGDDSGHIRATSSSSSEAAASAEHQGGPAKRRFLTKYLRRDRGESGTCIAVVDTSFGRRG
jgi:hypothetical protein